MTTGKKLLNVPYGAYHNPPIPEEARDLTHVEKGSVGGEYLRRFWQPVALTAEVGELPIKVRMFGEDLVLFRAGNGDYGLLDLHCSHRGTSLEFGIASETGLRCCYHGWLFGVDGRILETPGDPPNSTLKDRLCHGAYPVKEYRGLIFGYFGPPELKPEFPDYDSYHYPDDRLVPYCITYPCNWLQVHENVMDPAHGVFLHTRISFSQFADAWGELPVMEFVETPTGMIYVTTRRWRDKVWVRSNDIVLPNLAQVGHIWEDGQDDKAFNRVGITRWTTPVDNTTCKIIGWRHFHPEQDPRGMANEAQVGVESTDFFGQNGARSYEERQRLPGDFDAQTSQRPIAIHALEHLTACDKGVVMLRRLLNREMRKVARGEAPHVSPVRSAGQTPTYCHDTVVAIPPSPGGNDDALVALVGRKITEIVVEGDHQAADDRTERIRALIRDFARSQAARAAE
ncbi:MAG: Rieske 2Fe-2S domain-containing protein [Candidatus Eiseniibacteriota bacterium]